MIEVENVVKSYGSGESRSQVLQGISLEIKAGDFVVILGASGSGKSTFAYWDKKCFKTHRNFYYFLLCRTYMYNVPELLSGCSVD